MTEAICTLITAIATVICSFMGVEVTKRNKAQAEHERRITEQNDARAKESKLNLQMLNANSQLTIGLAMALKHGHCNGEVEEGLKAVQDASAEYTKFLEELAIDKIMK